MPELPPHRETPESSALPADPPFDTSLEGGEPDRASTETTPAVDRFQIGMKGLLFTVLLAGTSIGIFGKLYLQYPEIALAVLSLSSVVVPFILAVILLYRISASTSNPGRIKLFATGILLAPAAGLLTTALLSQMHFRRAGPMGLQTLSTEELLSQELPVKVDEPWVWDELEARLASNKLSAPEINGALQILLDHMKSTMPNGYDQPLHWQDDFVAAASRSRLADEALLQQIYLAFFRQPTIDMQRIRVSNSKANFEAEFGSAWADNEDFHFTLICDLKEVRWDGEKRAIENRYHNQRERADSLMGPFEIGKHKIDVELRFALVDKESVVGLDTRNLAEENWPKPLKSWTTVVSEDVEVYAENDPIVQLVTDRPPPLLMVKRLLTQKGSGDRTSIKLVLEDFESSLPISYEVFARSGKDLIRIGSFTRYSHGNGTTSRSALSSNLKTPLPEEIRKVDLIFKPFPRGLDFTDEVSEMCGHELTIPRVRLDRLDLSE